MTIAWVQSNGPSFTTPTTSFQTSAASGTVTAGNSVIVCIWSEKSPAGSQSITSVVDNIGNTYAKDKSVQNGTSTQCDVWRCDNVLGGASQMITVTVPANAYLTVAWAEFSVTAHALVIDNSLAAFGTNTGTNNVLYPSSGAFTTTTAATLLLVTFSNQQYSAVIVPTGFTRIAAKLSGGTVEDGDAAYQIVSSTQSGVNPTWSGGSNNSLKWACVGIAYAEAAGTTYQFFLDAPPAQAQQRRDSIQVIPR